MPRMSRDTVKKRSSSSAERLLSTYTPICAPTVPRVRTRSSSGCRMSRLKNSITPSTSFPRSMGIAKALRRPTRAAIGCPREVVVLRDVGDPRRPAGRPDAAGQTRPTGERHLAADGNELLEVRRAFLPAAHPAHCRPGPIHLPQGAVLPAEGPADGMEHARRGVGERCRLCQRARRLVDHQPVENVSLPQRIGFGRQGLMHRDYLPRGCRAAVHYPNRGRGDDSRRSVVAPRSFHRTTQARFRGEVP